MIEEIRALDPVNSLAARLSVIENLAENATPRYIVYSFVIYRAKATKFGIIV